MNLIYCATDAMNFDFELMMFNRINTHDFMLIIIYTYMCMYQRNIYVST